MSHPNIIRIFRVYETDATLYLVLELVEGGELFDFIVERGSDGLPEESARNIFQQIANAVRIFISFCFVLFGLLFFLFFFA